MARVQNKPEYQSLLWCAHNNLKTFISSLKLNIENGQNINQATHILRYHMADQFEWDKEYYKIISVFYERADIINNAYSTKLV